MHDIRTIRDNPAGFDAAMARRGISSASAPILALDEARRAAITAAEAALAERNAASKQVGAAKAAGDDAEFERLRALVAEKKAEIAKLEEDSKAKDAELRDMLLGLPNILQDDIPDGADENDNVELHRWGTRPQFSFTPVEHYELPGAKEAMDFETAAKLAGSRFVLMSAGIARISTCVAASIST